MLEAGGEYKELGLGADGLAILIVNYVHDDAEVMEKAKALGFLETNLPREERFVSEIISENEDKIKENLKEIERLQAKLEEFARESEKIEVLNDQLASIGALKKAPLKMTLETVYLEGWVRAIRPINLRRLSQGRWIYDWNSSIPSRVMPPTYARTTLSHAIRRPDMFQAEPVRCRPQSGDVFLVLDDFGMMMGMSAMVC